MGDGDGVDVFPGEAGLFEGLVDDGKNDFNMGARGDFGHDTTIDGVNIDLGDDDIGKNFRAISNDGAGGFVATGFDT